jgi:hypothetical protein
MNSNYKLNTFGGNSRDDNDVNDNNGYTYEYEDDEYNEDEYEQNDIAPPDISPEFREAILDAKNVLYQTIINGPNVGTPEAQDNKVLKKYMDSLNNLYILSINAENGIKVINDKNLSKFPKDARNKVQVALEYITTYFQKLSVVDKIPYDNHIRNSFKTYQFKLNNDFEE